MKTVTYASIKADEAWGTVSQHLQRRNDLLTEATNFLENHPSDHVLAGRIVVLQYHLRSTVRQLVRQSTTFPPATSVDQQLNRQWMVVHQMHYLLRQIDDQLLAFGRQSPALRNWREARSLRKRVRPVSKLSLN